MHGVQPQQREPRPRAAAGLAQGVPIDAVAAGLEAAAISPWRMELHRTGAGAVVINDAYNSNPTALAAAMHSLAAIDADRHVAIVGHMAELGEHSEARHAEMGDLAHELDIEMISVACPLYGTGIDVPTPEAAVDALGSLGAGDAVLVKASRSAGLESIADALR